MKIIKLRKEGKRPARKVYLTDEIIDIEEAVKDYGETEDTIILCDDKNNVMAIADWPTGWRKYKYNTEISPDEQAYWQDILMLD